MMKNRARFGWRSSAASQNIQGPGRRSFGASFPKASQPASTARAASLRALLRCTCACRYPLGRNYGSDIPSKSHPPACMWTSNSTAKSREPGQSALPRGWVSRLPDDLHYLWASGFRFSDAFPLILEAVDELGVRVVAFDSLGMALEGDALKGAVVIDFFRDRIDQLKRRGVSVLIVDHQSGLRPGESYQSKAQYGSVYKGYLSRSRLQLELDERNEVGTRVIVRQNKTNFGAPQWVCPVSTDSLPLGHSTSSQSNLFVL